MSCCVPFINPSCPVASFYSLCVASGKEKELIQMVTNVMQALLSLIKNVDITTTLGMQIGIF